MIVYAQGAHDQAAAQVADYKELRGELHAATDAPTGE